MVGFIPLVWMFSKILVMTSITSSYCYGELAGCRCAAIYGFTISQLWTGCRCADILGDAAHLQPEQSLVMVVGVQKFSRK